MAIVLLYSFHIVSARRDSMSAGRDLPFQFDKSLHLLLSMVLKGSFSINVSFTIVLSSYSIVFELINNNNEDKFIKNYCFTIV